MAQEQSHGCKFELQTGLISLRQSPYERVYMTVVEVNGGDSFPFGPAGKSSCNGSLLAKGSFRVTSLAKVLKEWFDLIIKQGLRPAGAGCGHEMKHLLVVASLPVGRGDTIMPRQEPPKTRRAASELGAHGIIREAA
jgi:hypothetical protein